MKIHQLHTAVKKHKIDEDEDVIDYKDSFSMQELEDHKKLERENQITDEVTKEVKEMIKNLPECPEKGRP